MSNSITPTKFDMSNLTMVDMSNLTMDELKKICKERNIHGCSGKTKNKLIDMIKQSYITTTLNINSVHCPNDIISGKLITKDKRHEIFGQVAGGSNSRSPEDYQRSKISEGTGIECKKTSMRINLRNNKLENISHPNTQDNGFDYSEDFDGFQYFNNNHVYYNFKCIVGSGGSQTRSLREVYNFINGQLNVLKSEKNVYFANILDGDESYNAMKHFNYLISLTEYESVKNKLYVGDLKGYFDWFKNNFNSL